MNLSFSVLCSTEGSSEGAVQLLKLLTILLTNPYKLIWAYSLDFLKFWSWAQINKTSGECYLTHLSLLMKICNSALQHNISLETTVPTGCKGKRYHS